MKAVYKYQLPFKEVAEVDLPFGAKVVRIDGLDGFLWLWAVVDTTAPIETRTFYLQKTGAPMPEGKVLHYLGCGAIFIQMELMMYVFEERPCNEVR